MKELEYIVESKDDFLRFLKSKFPLYHDSNVFLRDLHYGVMSYVEEKLGKRLKYLEAERVTLELAKHFEERGIFKKMDDKTWLLQYTEFALPRPVPSAKPTTEPPPQSSPAPAAAK